MSGRPAGNNDMDIFHIDRHRSQIVAQQFLGNNFDGVMITDGCAAYNGVSSVACRSCIVHLMRKAKEIKKQLQRRLKKICTTSLSDEGAKNIQEPDREFHRRFVFLDYP